IKLLSVNTPSLPLHRIQMMKAKNAVTPSQTFISDMVPFPWEVLYEGDADVIDKEQFWGLGYAPARILDDRDISQYVPEQTSPSDMLFCLHHKLRYTHQREWPEIEKLVRVTALDHFCVLGCHSSVRSISTGKDLFTYFGEASHNMLHF